MKHGTKNIASTVRALIEPIVAEQGCTLWDVEYVKEGTAYYLRITIDKEDGIDITDCERVHRAIDKPLDDADPIPDAYMLEVSSPGIERELKYTEHFEAFLGRDICVKAFAPLEEAGGVKQLIGTLSAHGEKTLTVKVDGRENVIPLEKIARVNSVYDYNINLEENR